MPTERFDAIVIGAGQAGGPLAGACAAAGWRTAIVEREHVGGTCVNEGCTPTKTLVASARVANVARRAADFGVDAGDVRVDMRRVRDRKRSIVASFRQGSERRLIENGVVLVEGDARFLDERTLAVRTAGGPERRLTAASIFINTGERPARPALPGLDRVPHLDSTSIMELDTLPRHLVVLGGGYIGLEFGQMFRRFGAEVTIVQRGPQLLAREDADVAGEVARIMREDGIGVILDAEAVRVAPADGGGVALTVRVDAAERTLRGSHLLIAAGRTPNTDRLNLRAAGVETDARGYIRVDERLETSTPGIWALGDVKGGPAFTHLSYDDYRIVRTNVLGDGGADTRNRLVPYTVFIDPQLGRVGLTEADALRSGRDVLIARLPMAHVARAIELDETRGFMKAVVDAESGRILGVAVLGVEGGEIMSALQLAMLGGLTWSVLRDAIFAHPALAESFNSLFATLQQPAATSSRVHGEPFAASVRS